ncbi:MAG: nucleoside deaminase [Candidatus Nanopelagicaceae bacterium]|jgi:tRNA(adenine34) deaminase|nr:nucleoside deaminase [Candidatus Nanopelagicaceae bacterium]
MDYEKAMRVALERAKFGELASGDVPVGAVMLNKDGAIISMGNNQRELLKDPLAHAEIVAIKSASRSIGSWRLEECTLVVTLEPCAMCAGAIMQARIPRVVFGAWDEKAGAAGSMWDLLRDPRALHKVEVITGVLESECAGVLKDFFSKQR